MSLVDSEHGDIERGDWLGAPQTKRGVERQAGQYSGGEIRAGHYGASTKKLTATSFSSRSSPALKRRRRPVNPWLGWLCRGRPLIEAAANVLGQWQVAAKQGTPLVTHEVILN
jgi:hypothetical protein